MIVGKKEKIKSSNFDNSNLRNKLRVYTYCKLNI